MTDGISLRPGDIKPLKEKKKIKGEDDDDVFFYMHVLIRLRTVGLRSLMTNDAYCT